MFKCRPKINLSSISTKKNFKVQFQNNSKFYLNCQTKLNFENQLQLQFNLALTRNFVIEISIQR